MDLNGIKSAKINKALTKCLVLLNEYFKMARKDIDKQQ